MALQRRRNHYRCPIRAVSAAVLLLLIIGSMPLIAPPLLDLHRNPSKTSKDSGVRDEDSDGVDTFSAPAGVVSNGPDDSNGVETFRVPMRVGSSSKDELWRSKLSRHYYGCSNASNRFADAESVTLPNRYLMIATSGGLNQQRTGITDAVVAARILNATLIVPKLDQRSFWKDASDFAEIFDVDWFISSLSKDVKIIEQLPKKGRKVIASPYTMRVPRKCSPRCYQNKVLPVLLKKHVVQLTKFDYRLANKLETDLQKLRCRVNYHALRFTEQIQEMGEKLIHRMKEKSKYFIALHLRFESDMLAFSGCYYGGGEKEKRELGAIRRRWKTLHIRNPDRERRQGKCPLTPEEVGLMLRALGFSHDVHIYVASGDVYGGEETLAPLKALFPNFHSKESLASKDELAPFTSFSSRMAALDFTVCDGSDVFVTNNNGNMARMLAGRRRYFGHKRTIRPNAKKVYRLFANRSNMTWDAFSSMVRSYQRGFMGEPKEVRPGRGEFHENPSTCICETSKGKEPRSRAEDSVESEVDDRGDGADPTAENSEDGPDFPDADYGEDAPQVLPNGTEIDYGLFIRQGEYQKFEEMLSD